MDPNAILIDMLAKHDAYCKGDYESLSQVQEAAADLFKVAGEVNFDDLPSAIRRKVLYMAIEYVGSI